MQSLADTVDWLAAVSFGDELHLSMYTIYRYAVWGCECVIGAEEYNSKDFPELTWFELL